MFFDGKVDNVLKRESELVIEDLADFRSALGEVLPEQERKCLSCTYWNNRASTTLVVTREVR